MKLTSVLAFAASSATLVSGWRLEVGRDRQAVFEGDRSRRCSPVGDGRQHRRYDFNPRTTSVDRDGYRREKNCCVRLFNDYNCGSPITESCDGGSRESNYGFSSFSVDCRGGGSYYGADGGIADTYGWPGQSIAETTISGGIGSSDIQIV
jgi:hypothetical protein